METTRTRAIQAEARAKVNLYLAVGERRSDGFHEVATVLQSVSLSDSLYLRPGPRAVHYSWAAGLDGALPGPGDLVSRAIEAAALQAPRAGQTQVQVTKSIPIGSGLGGGSADAAAALLALMELHGFTLGDSLRHAARELGADVGFCLQGGSAIGRGLGDELRPIACPAPLWWVLGLPDFSISTSQVYRKFDELPPSPAPPLEALADALEKGNLVSIAAGLHNDLEGAAFVIAPRLASLKQAMIEAGPLGVVMSGSGSAIAALCAGESDARFVARSAQAWFRRTEIVSSQPTGVELQTAPD